MKTSSEVGTRVGLGVCLCIGLALLGYAQNPSPAPGKVQKETLVTSHASGTFEVKVTPQALEDEAADPNLARLSVNKQFHGDLEGTSKGQMLAASTSVEGSAGYVAIERVTGTLTGRKGSFMLQHIGMMTRGRPQMNVRVVPDSGTDQLLGLAGTMTIKIEHGKHFYEFSSTLAETR
jgi:hypothetical protein